MHRSSPDGPAAARRVAIYRHNLFRPSEPFITEQARHLRRYRPLFVGRLRYGPPPQGAWVLTLAEHYRRLPMAGIGWQMLSGSAQPYRQLLEPVRPDLIHAHFGIEGVAALPLARALGVPLVTTFHGFDATLKAPAMLSSPAWFRYPLFKARLAREGRLFLCVSAFIRDRLLAQGFPEARTRVHYIGVDCRAIRPRVPGEEEMLILHVARLVEVKGTRQLLRAFARMAGSHREARLEIIGAGPLMRPLESLAARLGIAARVNFRGAQPHAQVLAAMRKAAMLVLPGIRTGTGREEGLGMVLLEAAASGVPAIGSRVGGIPECIVDGATGYLVPERDEAALAARMAALFEDRALRHAMGVAARTWVESRFDIERQTAGLEALYDAVLAGESRA